MIFQDRTEAGQKLADALKHYAGRDDVIVLAIPRGGVTVAFEVARALRAPLDVFVLRKLGVPWQEELAFGAIAGGGVRVLDEEVVRIERLSPAQVEAVTAKEQRELERRERVYRGDRPPLDVQGRTVILVDDGIATGSSMRAGIAALKRMKPGRVVVAVPVAPPGTVERLRRTVDEFICLHEPEALYAVGQYYLDFSPVSDEEVTHLLRNAETSVADGAGSRR